MSKIKKRITIAAAVVFAIGAGIVAVNQVYAFGGPKCSFSNMSNWGQSCNPSYYWSQNNQG